MNKLNELHLDTGVYGKVSVIYRLSVSGKREG